MASKLTHDCEYCFALRRAIERTARKALRSMRFGARVFDELREESVTMAEKPLEWLLRLPRIANDPKGFERQVLADLQLGLMALEGASNMGREALVAMRDQ